MDRHRVAAKERATGCQVAAANGGIDVGRQGLRSAAVGQGDGLLLQPDDVGGEAGDLARTERNAGAKAKCFGKAQAAVHQALVLLVVALVIAQKALARQLGNLLADELLFVKAVAEPLLRDGRLHAERLEHVVAAQPLAVAGKCGVGLHQEVGCRAGCY